MKSIVCCGARGLKLMHTKDGAVLDIVAPLAGGVD